MKEDVYPEYARPDSGCSIQKGQNMFTNKDVVPHSKQLIVKFDCHINLETQGHDEVKAFLDGHYISSVKAAWHLFEFGMHLE
ncbi:hypothetical protein PAXRUDRAFT_16692 [Paxillus rubicundulus Ve08.2h10]|uniref:Uncharacterized protein n=1 Tax=Paxillus rubicundulus Ve08.2h10 TaxID=930991 RepID=A0A0D0C6Q9_9AGAM|nr:hypothetical protein PAXRUDRAFT_16692 [Paxillus rubicundulus Ve08.2h10]